jgi:hypothetical protein
LYGMSCEKDLIRKNYRALQVFEPVGMLEKWNIGF